MEPLFSYAYILTIELAYVVKVYVKIADNSYPINSDSCPHVCYKPASVCLNAHVLRTYFDYCSHIEAHVYAKRAFSPFQNYAAMFSVTACLQPFLVTGFLKKTRYGLSTHYCFMPIVHLLSCLPAFWRVIYRATLILQISVLISGCYLFYIEFISSLTISLLFLHFDLQQFPYTLGYCLFLGWFG